MLTKKIVGSVLISTLLFSQAVFTQTAKRIQFAKGQSSATVTGTLKSDSQAIYKIGAKKGQKLTVDFKSNVGKNAGITIFAPDPDGENKLIWGEDGLGSKSMEFDLNFTGDYEIEVGSTRRCSYTLIVKIR
ncbi:MAG TPA: hypothetical protein VHQ01_11590 [Pyrinomonadaceae bacterium]|nr:hypothetical protein [Pyrinomonadaceae bacterium]